MFSCEFSKISKNTIFTEQLRTTASAFSFSQAATGGVLWKKMSLEISQENSQEKTFGLRNFQKHLFYRTLLDDCFWLFRATLLKWGTANNVWKKSHEYSLPRNANFRSTANNVWKNSDEYSLHRNANLRSTVQVYHFFLGSI